MAGILSYSELTQFNALTPDTALRQALEPGLRLSDSLTIPVAWERLAGNLLLVRLSSIKPLDGLSQLAQLVSGQELTPEGLQGLKALVLENAAITVDLGRSALRSVQLELSYACSWDIGDRALGRADLLVVRQVSSAVEIDWPLDSALREITVELGAEVQFDTGRLDLSCVLPAVDLKLSLKEGSSLSLGSLSQRFGLEPPSGLSTMQIDQLQLSLSPTSSSASFQLGLSGSWTVRLGNADYGATKLSVAMERQPGRTAGQIGCTVVLASIPIELEARAETGQGWTFTGALASGLAPTQQPSLRRLLPELLPGTEVPSELPELSLSALRVSVSPGSGQLAIHAECMAQFSLGSSALRVDKLLFDLNRPSSAGVLTCTMALSGGGQISNELRCPSFALNFRHDGANRRFALDGSLDAKLFDQPMRLGAALTTESGTRTLQLTADFATPLKLGYDAGQPSTALYVALTSASVKVSTTRTESAAWSMSASGSLIAGEFLRLQEGTLTVLSQPNKSGVIFTARNSEIELPFGSDRSGPRCFFGVTSLELLRANGSWSLDSTVLCGLRGLPLSIEEVFPKAIKAKLLINSSQATLKILDPLAPLSFEIPKVDSRELGRVWFKLNSLAVSLGRQPELTLGFAVALPYRLNNLFGMSEKDATKPAIEFFRTVPGSDAVVPDTKAPWIRWTLGINGTKVSAKLLDSPIQAIDLRDGKLTIDLAEYGKLDLAVPTLECQLGSASFSATGSMEIVRPLRLPTAPLKMLLKHAGLERLADSLPTSIPCDGLNLLDSQGLLNTKAVATLLEGLVSPLPQEVRDGLDRLREISTRLPTRFLAFLNFQLPRSLSYSIAVDPSGTVKLDLRVSKDKPLRLLVPTLGPLGIPMLMGIEMRGISFGPVLGGALLLLQTDVTLDIFDIITLAVAASGVTQDVKELPAPQTLVRKVEARDVFMLMIPEFPVPIPLFYEELSFTYVGIEGAEIGTTWRCPMPSLDLGEVVKVLGALIKFFTERDYYLDPSDPPENFNLRFSSGPHYLALPSYLGGGLLGDRNHVEKIDLYSSLAKLLNGIKRPSVGELVEILPYNLRLGDTGLKLGPLDFQVGWAFTSVRELAQNNRNASFNNAWSVAQRLVPGWTPPPLADLQNSDGLLFALNGHCRVQYLSGLSGEFAACAYRDPRRAGHTHTKFYVQGDLLSGAVSADLSGELHMAPTQASIPIPAPFRGPGWALDIRGTAPQGGIGPIAEVNLNQPNPVLADGKWAVCLWLRIDADKHDMRGLFHFSPWDLADGVNKTVAYFRAETHVLVFCFGQDEISCDLTEHVGSWVHIAIEAHARSHLNLYVNGSMKASAASRSPPQSLWFEHLVIGKVGGCPLNGQVAGLRIFHIAPHTSYASIMHRVRELDSNCVAQWVLSAEEPDWLRPSLSRPQSSTMYARQPSQDGSIPSVVRLLPPASPQLTDEEQAQAQGQSVLRLSDVGAYVDVPGFRLAAGSAVSVEFWIHVRADQVGCGSAFSIGNRNGTSRLQCHVPWSDGLLYWDCGDATQPGGRLAANFQPYLGKWTHVALVSGGVGGRFMGIFLNGELVASQDVSLGTTQALQGLTIGRESAIPGYTFEQKGLLCDFRVFSYAREQSEIRRDMLQRLNGREPGLLGYWPLSEQSGVQATDLGLLACHGTLRNASFVAPHALSAQGLPRLQRVFRANEGSVDDWQTTRPVLNLNGGYVEAPELVLPAGSELTIEFWIFVRADQAGGSIFSIGNQGSPHRVQAHCPWYDNKLYWDFGDIGTERGRLVTDFSPYLNQWVHVTLVRSAVLQIFINGEKVAVQLSSCSVNVPLTGLTIGRESSSHGTFVQRCWLSEFRVWCSARTYDEIQKNMRRSLNGNEQGLLAYYRLSEGRGVLAADSGPWGYHGTLQQVTWADVYAQGQQRPPALQRANVTQRSALQLTGNGAHFAVPDFSWSAGQAITIEFWMFVREDQLQANELLSIGDNEGNNRLQVHYPYENKRLNWNYGELGTPGAQLVADLSGYTGSWVHVGLVSTGTSGTERYAAIYLNHSRVAYTAAASAPNSQRVGLLVGKGKGGTAHLSQRGRIMDLRVWNYARSQQELDQNRLEVLTGQEPGLMGYWPLCEGGGSLAIDFTRRTAPVRLAGARFVPVAQLPTLPPAPAPVLPAALDNAPAQLAVLRLNGTDGYLDIPDLDWSYGSDVTIELWTYVPTTADRGLLLSIGNQGIPNNITLLFPWAGDDLSWDHGHRGSSTGIQGRATARFADCRGRWVHVAVCAGADREMAIYLNGQSVAIATPAPVTQSLRGMTVGCFTSSGTRYFGQALVTELRLWNTCRSPADIQANMQRRLSGDEAGLWAYWPLQQSGGGKVLDRGVRGLHAVLRGGASWTTERELAASSLPALSAASTTAMVPAVRRSAYLLHGQASLQILGQRLLNGELHITDQSYEIALSMNLSLLGILQLTGELVGYIDERGFDFRASGAISVWGQTLVGGSFHISQDIIELEGLVLGKRHYLPLYRRDASGTRDLAAVAGEAPLSPNERAIVFDGQRVIMSLDIPRPPATRELLTEGSALRTSLAPPSLSEIHLSPAGAHWVATGALFDGLSGSVQVHALSFDNGHLMHARGDLVIGTDYLLAAEAAHLRSAHGLDDPEQRRLAAASRTLLQQFAAYAQSWGHAVAQEAEQLQARIATATNRRAELLARLPALPAAANRDRPSGMLADQAEVSSGSSRNERVRSLILAQDQLVVADTALFEQTQEHKRVAEQLLFASQQLDSALAADRPVSSVRGPVRIVAAELHGSVHMTERGVALLRLKLETESGQPPAWIDLPADLRSPDLLGYCLAKLTS